MTAAKKVRIPRTLKFQKDFSVLTITPDSPSPTPTPTAKPTGSKDDEKEEEEAPQTTTSKGPPKPIFTDLNTGGLTESESATGTGKVTGNATTTRAPKKTEFDPQDPPGGVVMITPAPTDGYQLYKIGEYVTWVWNYTNVQATPTGIDLYVRCSKVPQPWTLTQNMSFAEQGSYTWDTKKFQTENVRNPLLTEQYTLVIANAEGGISATPEAGYFGTWSGFTFGMYEPQPYHDTGDGWQCASCSGAMSSLIDRRAFGVAIATSLVTVLSFTWFVVGFGGLM
jgi:hypothetical protein